MSFIIITEWASAPAIIPVEPAAPIVMQDIVVAPSGIVRDTPIAPVVVFIPKETTPVAGGASFRSIRTFNAMPSEADLRYPAKLVNGTWIAEIDPDMADPKIIDPFQLADAPGYDDGKYKNPNVNNAGPLSAPFRAAD